MSKGVGSKAALGVSTALIYFGFGIGFFAILLMGCGVKMGSGNRIYKKGDMWLLLFLYVLGLIPGVIYNIVLLVRS